MSYNMKYEGDHQAIEKTGEGSCLSLQAKK